MYYDSDFDNTGTTSYMPLGIPAYINYKTKMQLPPICAVKMIHQQSSSEEWDKMLSKFHEV